MKNINTRNDLLHILPKKMVICEIGVFKGEFASNILSDMDPKELHLIDLFEGIVPCGDKDGENMIDANLNHEYEVLTEKYSKSDVVKLHKGSSSEILKKFSNDYFDMVYIDADHSYEGVKSDLEICYNKVKNGGYICGHDYTIHRFPGVVQAVDEFNEKNNYNIEIITSDGCPSFCIKNNKI